MVKSAGKQPPAFREGGGGNVTTVFALSVPVLILAIAVGSAFASAAIVRTKLNAAADAASLAALTPTMMQETDAQAQVAATAMFDARAAAISSLVAGHTQVTVTITHPNNNPNSRQVQVTYTAETNSILGSLFNTTGIMNVGGTSTAQATTPPNIDFYLLLDNSPSMALPATAAGITQMQQLTPTQDGNNGCAFACHQASTNNSDTQGNPCSDGSKPTLSGNQYCDTSKGLTQIDNYTLARKNNITLRLDELTTGITSLMQTASGYQGSGIYSTPPNYRFAAYSMDSSWQIGVTNTRIMALTSDYINQWSTNSSSFGVMEMFDNNYFCANSSCSSGSQTSGQGDVATSFDNALSSMLNTLPTPGNGTNQPGDSPQEVLFFVTDGVEDEVYGGSRVIQLINGSGGSGVNYCTQIKNKGVKIAILYTEYLAVPANSFYESNVAPFQGNIGSALQACASPGLYYDAAIGDNLGNDLSTLFNIVAQQAALSQ